MIRANRLVFAILVGLVAPPVLSQTPTERMATGVVFHDRNGDGVRTPNEEGIPNVRVSNQRDVVVTDRNGRYTLPVSDDTVIFVVKPRGWMLPLDVNNVPRGYYIHKPNGSPKQRFPGVPPTGPLPDSVDFGLRKNHEPDRFKALFFGDPQVNSELAVTFMAHDVVEELIGTDAAFGISLGDNAFDDLSVTPSLVRVIGRIGIPWWYALGNHDENYDSPDDKHADETFERYFGPAYYSFDYGPVHFIVLDDVMWRGLGPNGEHLGYAAGIGQEQLTFIKNDLAHVPEKQLVVLAMHIPLTEVAERKEILGLLASRPHSFSIAGHTHTQTHRFLGAEDGWTRKEPHHLMVHGTACGDWWQGKTDEVGLPHTTMRDGTPNGYSIITFDGNKYSVDTRVSRRPATYKMNIYTPDIIARVDAGATEVVANIFAGSSKSVVEMRFGEAGEWTPMKRDSRVDPYLERLKADEADFPKIGRNSNPVKSSHIWVGLMPANPAPGTYTITVREHDMFGKTNIGHRIVRIR